MKTLLICMVFGIFSVSCNTSIKTFQINDKGKIGLRTNKFRGTIFTDSYPTDHFLFGSADSLNRFTPKPTEIALAEYILKTQIKRVNRSRFNQFGKRQYIDRHLNKYFRQYVGFVNENGNRIIHINFSWDRFSPMDRIKGYWDGRLDYSSDYSVTLDGGSRYWSVNVNLTLKNVYGLSVNGIA